MALRAPRTSLPHTEGSEDDGTNHGFHVWIRRSPLFSRAIAVDTSHLRWPYQQAARETTPGDDDILAVNTKRLKQLTRKRGKDCKICPDIGEASSPRLDRLKPFLDSLHEL